MIGAAEVFVVLDGHLVGAVYPNGPEVKATARYEDVELTSDGSTWPYEMDVVRRLTSELVCIEIKAPCVHALVLPHLGGPSLDGVRRYHRIEIVTPDRIHTFPRCSIAADWTAYPFGPVLLAEAFHDPTVHACAIWRLWT